MEKFFAQLMHEADINTNNQTPEGSQLSFPNSNWSQRSLPVTENHDKLRSETFKGLIRGEHQLEDDEILIQETLHQDIKMQNQLDTSQLNLNTDDRNEWSLQDIVQGFSSDSSNYTNSEYELDNGFGTNHCRGHTLHP